MTDLPTLDLTAAVIENATFRIGDLFWANFDGKSMVLVGKTFNKCTIQGPAVLAPLHACQFNTCDFGDSLGDTRNMLYRPMSKTHLTGGVVMSRCIFNECNFFACGFTGDEAFLNTMIAVPYRNSAP